MKVLLAAGLINAVVVLRYFPDWLVGAQWAADLYHAYTRAAPKNVLLQPFVVSYSWPALLLLAMFVCSPRLRPTTGPFLLVAGYGLVTFVLQGKGWSYQFLLVAIMLYIALGLALMQLLPEPAVIEPAESGVIRRAIDRNTTTVASINLYNTGPAAAAIPAAQTARPKR